MDSEAKKAYVAWCRRERAPLRDYLIHLESGTSEVGGGPDDPLLRGRTQAEIARVRDEIASIDSAIREFVPAH